MFDEASKLFNLNFEMLKKRTQLSILGLYSDFRVIYDNYYDEIKILLSKTFLDRPYKKSTLDRFFWLHRDEIQKILNRKIAGLFDTEPTVLLYTGKEETNQIDGETITNDITDERLTAVLDEARFLQKNKEAMKKALFFNICLVQPIWRDGKFELDIITPDEFVVETKKNYLLIKSIKIGRIDENGNIYYTYWSETEHYNIDPLGNKISINDDNKNPYINYAEEHNTSALPFSILRIKEGADFYGEPNWNLFLYQLVSDLTNSDNLQGEALQKYPTLRAVDVEMNGDVQIGAGAVITAKSTPDGRSANIDYLNPNTDWVNIRANQQQRHELTLMSEGIPSSVGSMAENRPAQFGAKTLDELELQESREDLKTISYYFNMDLLEKIRMVYNYEATDKLTEEKESYFEFKFNEDKPFESEESKAKRREDEIKYNIKTPIDFIMEDFGVGKQEAIEIWQKNKRLNSQNNTRFTETFDAIAE